MEPSAAFHSLISRRNLSVRTDIEKREERDVTKGTLSRIFCSVCVFACLMDNLNRSNGCWCRDQSFSTVPLFLSVVLFALYIFLSSARLSYCRVCVCDLTFQVSTVRLCVYLLCICVYLFVSRISRTRDALPLQLLSSLYSS